MFYSLFLFQLGYTNIIIIISGSTVHLIESWPHLSSPMAGVLWFFADFRSLLTLSTCLALGRYIPLLPSGLCSIILYGISLSSILITCPAHLSLAVFITALIYDSLKRPQSSLLNLILQSWSSLAGPKMFLSAFLSKILTLFFSFC
jgi:hypothetical protein